MKTVSSGFIHSVGIIEPLLLSSTGPRAEALVVDTREEVILM